MNGRIREVLAHVAVALSRHVKARGKLGLPSPPELLEISEFLTALATERQDATTFAGDEELGDSGFMSNQPMLLTRSQAAAELGLSVRTVDRLIADGALPAVAVGKSRRVRRSDLLDYVETLGRSTFREDIETKEPA